MLKGLTIATRGTYSGTLLINGASHAISGSFNLTGQATNLISRPASQGGPLELEMTLELEQFPAANHRCGTCCQYGHGLGGQQSDCQPYGTNTLPSAEYTMLIPPDFDNTPPTDSPGGYSYALITNHLGTATITGALADGTAFNQTVPVSADGYVPIYANLYASKGLLLGWINLELTNIDAAGVTPLTWIHPAERASGLYTNGFTTTFSSRIKSCYRRGPILRRTLSSVTNLTSLSILDTINDTQRVHLTCNDHTVGQSERDIAL